MAVLTPETQVHRLEAERDALRAQVKRLQKMVLERRTRLLVEAPRVRRNDRCLYCGQKVCECGLDHRKRGKG